MTYAPLLSDAELSQINAEREELLDAAMTARSPANVVHLIRHRDGTEKLLSGFDESTLTMDDDLFNRCTGHGPWATPAAREHVIPQRTNDQPSAISWRMSDAVIALVLVLTIALVFFGVAP